MFRRSVRILGIRHAAGCPVREAFQQQGGEVLFVILFVHADVFALDVDRHDRPAGTQRLLHKHLRGIRLPRAHGAKDPDIAREEALVG